jgi:hypothetical protein
LVLSSRRDLSVGCYSLETGGFGNDTMVGHWILAGALINAVAVAVDDDDTTTTTIILSSATRDVTLFVGVAKHGSWYGARRRNGGLPSRFVPVDTETTV